MKVFSVTDKGRVRQLNEDYYYLPVKGEHFAAVADGMGGHAAGEVASYTAITTAAKILRRDRNAEPKAALLEAFRTAHEQVCRAAKEQPGREGMGTTLTLLLMENDTAYLGHVGDSRAYRLRGGVLEQMSEDHSYVEELVKSGIITRQQARSHPKRNIITRCIGVYPDVEADILSFPAEPDDVWLLCSDGLTGYLTDEELEQQLLKTDLSWQEKLNGLRDTALQRGGADNITAVIVTGGPDE